ncbi:MULTISPECIES: glycoside hydrolase family 105 protein [unclassified Caulobacter]|uniref:glycoside hydrolase family 88/105 protein n=1 Tax=unclassified Caulobacter TaxID=2648921 RepID=UPI0006F911D6|nr:MULTISPECIES: glycoside hydrolase family 88 protein [unclassified Caulobacter]KQV58741.1 glucuronyl hydrolase [Caulobacter sp. Root342]KQV68750.1 glucuronyl hydrolase [Caulobacter sp. Root343]
MRVKLATALACLAFSAAGALAAPPPSAPPAATVDVSASALTLGRTVADWQLRHMDGQFDYVRTRREGTQNPRGWIQAAFYVGLTAFAERTGDPRYAQAMRAHGVAQGWGLGKRPLHADDHAIAQTWIWLNARDHDPAQIAPVKARFDAILADPPKADLTFIDGTEEQPCQARWCWSDALFMAPPTWTALSAITGDPRYAAYGDREFWATTDYLLDKEYGLYFRDSRFFDRRDDQGRKIFWSRGNGWVYAGIVNILKTLPANHPDRPRYVALFKRMSAKLVTLQKPDGYWPVSLLAPEHSPPETSGAGFFVYGLAWGVNQGLLKDPKYPRSARLGWSALAKAVGPDGKVGWVQQVGYAPDHVEADDTQLYGSGAVLLAASEVSRGRF